VDFWDLTKLIFRRWYIAVPLLALTGLASIYTVKTVKPDYKATAYVQLIPPPEASITTNVKSLRNPWLDLGLGSLNTAATYATVDKRFLNELRSDGMSDNVVITNGYPSPTATIEVIGTSQEIATATTDRVVQHFDDEVKSLQDAYSVQTPGRILTRRLDTGTNLEETGGKVKRALVAVLGAGVLLTAAITIATDAVMRRRKRRKGGADELEAAGAPPVFSTAAVETPGKPGVPASTVVRSSSVLPGERTVTLNATNGMVRQRSSSVVRSGAAANGGSVNGGSANSGAANGGAANGGTPGGAVNGAATNGKAPDGNNGRLISPSAAEASPDATIVLPGALYGKKKPKQAGGNEH
jgi:hypothetical protein